MRENVVKVFIAYAHEDENLLGQLQTHLAVLQREGLINPWHDHNISPGEEWAHEIDANLNKAEVILLLISADFLASDFCYSIEMKRAIERHKAHKALVIPIILRPCQWKISPLRELLALPKNGRPVSNWPNLDEAFDNIAEGIKKAVEKLLNSNPSKTKQDVPERTIDDTTGISIAIDGARNAYGRGILPLRHPLRGRVIALLSKKVSRFILVLLAVILLMGGGILWSTYLREQKTAPGTLPLHYPLVYRGHSQAVETLAWSPNGAYLASGGDDHSVQVWNASTGKRITLYQGHGDIVNSLVWSPGGTLIASASADHSVQVWNAFTGQLKYQYDGYGNNVVAIDWSPDGKHLALGGTVKTIQILDGATGALQQTFTGHTGTIWCLKWSPDGHYLASGSRDHTVRVWNSQGQTITHYQGQHGDIYLNDLAWSTDNKNILSGSDDGTITIWNAFTGTTLVSLTPGIQGIGGLSWLHNTLLAAGNDNGSVTIRDLKTKTVITVYKGHTKSITVVAFSPDGKHIASGSKDTTVQIWNPV